jgi:hypothetical protein
VKSVSVTVGGGASARRTLRRVEVGRHCGVSFDFFVAVESGGRLIAGSSSRLQWPVQLSNSSRVRGGSTPVHLTKGVSIAEPVISTNWGRIRHSVHGGGIPMDAAEILDHTHAKGLPKAALQAATAQRVEIVPVFLLEIDSYFALEPADRAKPTPLCFIFHLLGEWRERVAYRPLARLLRCADHEVEAILGDGITSTSHRVMGGGLRRRPAAALRHHPRPECRAVRSVADVRGARHAGAAWRTRPRSGRPISA